MANANKLTLKKENENLIIDTINLNVSLNFDFTSLTDKYRPCDCQEKVKDNTYFGEIFKENIFNILFFFFI